MVLVGVVAMLSLPTAQFPNIADPQIQVKAMYPGADAQTVAESVATPIEQQMSGVSGMNYMYSTSASNGQMTLTVDFALGTDPNTDQILAQMRSNQANSQLPSAVINSGVTVQQSTVVAADAARAVLAEQHLRQHLPGELRLHQPELRADPRAGHGFRYRSSAPANMPCASG